MWLWVSSPPVVVPGSTFVIYSSVCMRGMSVSWGSRPINWGFEVCEGRRLLTPALVCSFRLCPASYFAWLPFRWYCLAGDLAYKQSTTDEQGTGA